MKDSQNFTLRPANSNDATLFYSVIDLTMREFIIATWGRWDEVRVRAESHLHSRSPNSQVIEIDNISVGVLRVARFSTYIELEQIYLLPKYQRLGIGSALINQLIAEADRSSIPIRLRVMAINPAKKFYEHLEFIVAEEIPDFFLMEKVP
ncbi:GNAT family N-acetyltransferase [Chamaesiphon sp. VAR_48_metabat_403]|uniref:GNAT family N-acetyltransferase n=1 Tax=Chamaesiphon sp. VAR_48_metabat_403 TaxID=2964700 RepID=UPI00286DD544|nr:GNAT family N-acetyltransferase [Chamaesiphon sp. VAR_48_metabat_403]